MPELENYLETYLKLRKWLRNHSFTHNGRLVVRISRFVTGYRDGPAGGDPDSSSDRHRRRHQRDALCLPGCSSSQRLPITAGSTTYPGEARHPLQPCRRREAVLQRRLWRHTCQPAASPTGDLFEADVEQRGKCVVLTLTHVDSQTERKYLVERRQFGLVCRTGAK